MRADHAGTLYSAVHSPDFHSILSVILDSMKREMPPQWLSRENLILGRISTGWTITFLERWVASSKFL